MKQVLAHCLTAGVAMAALIGPAHADQLKDYYRAGAWSAFSGRNNSGTAVCGVGTTVASDNRRLSIRFAIGGSDTTFAASKPDWSIPAGTHASVVMQIGLNTPWTIQGAGAPDGHGIRWTMDPNAIRAFDQQFRVAKSMTITFPDGNEPPWTVSLSGSSMISDTLGRCVRDLTQQVQSNQPAAAGAPASQAPTQPFSAPPADNAAQQAAAPPADNAQQPAPTAAPAAH